MTRTLAECAAREGLRFAHVPSLGGKADGAWPGPSGYSFSAWVRFDSGVWSVREG